MKLLRLPLAFALLVSAAFAADPAFDAWVDSFSADWIRADPESATAAQYFSGAEQDKLDRLLTPVSNTYRDSRVAAAKQGLAALAKFDRAKLDGAEKASADIIKWSLDDVIEGDTYRDFEFVFDQFNGRHVGLIDFLTQVHPIRNTRDVDNYLARLALVAGNLDEGIDRARDAAKRGFLMPGFIYKSALGQFDHLLADPAPKNELVVTLDERIAKLPAISAADRAKAVAAAEKIVADSVIPALRRVQAMLREQQPRATDDAGIWRLPNGDKAYAYYLRRMTTTNFTPEQVHQLGLKEVARITGEMEAILTKLGFTQGTFNERVDAVEASLQPPANPDPRPGIIARNEQILRDAEKRAALIFDLRPAAPIVVKREPAFSEATAAAHYALPAKDGSLPGIYWCPVPGPTYDLLDMRTTAYHEGVPGHHFQLALQQEEKSLPQFRRDGVFGFVSAHGEGWALYAERLAVENGWYEGDEVGHLGQLSDELLRARRLVVDTGLHAKHWTRQQVIDYGMSVAETERYIVWPGQACSYKVGQLKILELRAKAKAALGAKFDIKQFHNVVLRTGNAPLAVLENVIDDYIASAK